MHAHVCTCMCGFVRVKENGDVMMKELGVFRHRAEPTMEGDDT